MFLNKVFKFLSGYVILSLSGLSIERFINICMHRKIRLLSISKHERDKAEICVYMRDFCRLRAPAYKTRTRIHIKEKKGFPVFFKRYGRRYALASGAVFIAVMLFVGSKFIWIVDIEGADNVDKEKLAYAIRLTGLRSGVLKSSLPSGSEMKTTIMSNTDDLSWAWVYVKGARAVVSVRYRADAPTVTDKTVPCDIVAMCDGVISSITAKTGKAWAKKGDTVSAGDVLVAGTLDSADGTIRTVHAEGDVRARVFRTVSGEYSLHEQIRTPNGNNKMLVSVTLFSKNINFFKNNGISSADYDTISNESRIDTPIGRFGICTTHLTGVDVSENTLTMSEITQRAVYELEEKISQNLTGGTVLISKNVRTQLLDSNTVRVILDAEFEQNIGLERIIN